jgi:hypothetical protein
MSVEGDQVDKLKLNDSLESILIKMSVGNPGAAQTIIELFTSHEQIDGDSVLGSMGSIFILDRLGIYGSEIYILYSDKSNRDIRQLILLLRATQLGFFPALRVKLLASDQANEINITEHEWKQIDQQVCDRLPNFQKKQSQ